MNERVTRKRHRRASVARFGLLLAGLWMLTGTRVGAVTRVLSSSDRTVELEVLTRDVRLVPVIVEGRSYVRADVAGGLSVAGPGQPDVPVLGEVVGIPFGASITAEVRDAVYREYSGVQLVPVPEQDVLGNGESVRVSYKADPTAYAQDRFLPGPEVAVSSVGLLRDQRVASLSIRPIQHNPARRVVRVATRLSIVLRFDYDGRRLPSIAPAAPEAGTESFYGGLLLNAAQAARWRGRQVGGGRPGLEKVAAAWLDPTLTYYKLRISEDGVYRLDASWFSGAGIPFQPEDLDRVQLYLDGAEVPMYGKGEALYFIGRYRRAPDRDFQSDFGREQIYWLAIGLNNGLRYQPVDASPDSGFPEAGWFDHTVHAEVDSIYDPLGEAADADRDHFYWQKAGSGFGSGPITPAQVAVRLPGYVAQPEQTVRVRVAMHGLTAPPGLQPDHRTVVQVAGTVVSDDRWDGQTAFVANGQLPVSAVAESTTVTLAVPGAPDYPEGYVDQVLLNWVEVTYPRRFRAESGRLAISRAAGAASQTYSVDGFRTQDVLGFDVGTGQVLEGMVVTPLATVFQARFQVARGPGSLILADSEAVAAAPDPEPHNGVDLSGPSQGAAYLIVTHPVFREAADLLADHRRSGGLTVRVVEIADVYDAFSFGQPDPSALRAFLVHAYETWSVRPVYLMLLGRAGFDFNDVFEQARFGRRNYVPALAYQATSRGLAFTDHPFGAVAGDDDFLDVFVGRISVNTLNEAATVVEKIIRYDALPQARWRDRILYMAAYEEPPIFTDPSDDLAADFTDPFGLEAFKVYNRKDTPPQPNEDTQEVIRQINEGRLIVNFMGHGSVATMQRFLSGSYQQGNYNYMSRIQNGDRLPLVLAMSCLNGQFGDPRILCLAEEMTKKRNGGAIGYISSAALSFNVSNLGMNTEVFRAVFQDSILEFGPSMAAAKTRMVSASPVLASTVFGYNLIGDPAQALALPGGPDLLIDVDGLRVEADGEIVAEDTTRIRLHIQNAGITPDKDATVVVIDRNTDTGAVDTLLSGRLPAFGQSDSVAALWPLTGRAGTHLITAYVDPLDVIAELDETNNSAELEVTVFGALTAVATMPAESQVMASGGVQLAVRSGALEDRSPVAEFEISLTPGFTGTPVAASGLVPAVDGMYLWRPSGLTTGAYYWRARLSEGDEVGPWTEASVFTLAGSVPDRQLVWRQEGVEALRLGSGEDVVPYADGAVGRVLEPPPVRLNDETRDLVISAEGVSGSAVVCADGTYLYAKRFYTSPPIYPGPDTFVRIGTGLGGSVAGMNYGVLSEAPVNGISATYHSDGYIYADDGAQDELVRISVSTGRADRVQVPDGLLEFQTGFTLSGHSLITSDGSLVYNVAAGIAGTRRVGWSIRVFDPSDGWRLVREYQADPTATGFTFLHTDGILADGRYLYLVEFGTGLTHRVRVLDARDGSFVTEYDSDQAETDILGGQYDWVNNKVWMGQLNGGTLYGYEGRRLPDSGRLTSSPIGPAAGFDAAQLQIRPSGVSGGRVVVDILGEDVPGVYSPLPEWSGLEATSSIDLSSLPVHVSRIKLRAHLYGSALGASSALDAWEVRYRPVSDVSIANLRADRTAAEELEPVNLTVDVQNRGPLDRVLGTVVAFYSGQPEQGRLIGRQAIPEETSAGRQAAVTLEWNTAKFAGTNFITARAEDLQGRPTLFSGVVEAAEPVQISPSGDQSGPEVTVTALDASGEVRVDDYLPAALRLRVVLSDSSGIDTRSVSMRLTGPEGDLTDDAHGDRVSGLAEESRSLALLYQTELTDGDYTFEVSGRDRLGNGPASGRLAFKVSSELSIQRVLNVPNPMSDQTVFTYLLSRPSEVKIRVYTVSGRLVRILEDAPGMAGYNQVAWDGRDGDGHLLANGVYLYTVSADDGTDRRRVKERLLIYR